MMLFRHSRLVPRKAIELTSFDTLGLTKHTLSTLEANNFTVPTPIQAESIPLLMQGRDMVGLAQTGTGKTLAFGLPIVEAMACGAPVLTADATATSEIAGEAALLLPEPHGDARRLSASFDIARPKELTADVELELSCETLRQPFRLRARGPGVQTAKIVVDADMFASGFARFGLRVVSAAPLPAPLRLVGLLIASEETGDKRLAFA